ncbi:hypothetical protein [Rouxiella silvae]|uniref:hypothetical protein n=1 Tax=Rouxiella silvae TaxID=1646373 RepID=UPI001301DB4D|nr:hypothetical protein [Rouxiella silvae]
MINKVAVISAIVGVTLLSLLVWAALHYHGKSVVLAGEITTLTKQKNEAEFITKSQALSVGIFNLIAGATLNDQKKNEAASQNRQLIIKTVLQKESCAVVNIPSAASDSLYSHYNAIRSGSGNADTSKSSTAVPTITPAK